MLKSSYQNKLPEAGCDEAGRGCLAGPVYAAAVILPRGFKNKWLNDSKKISEALRFELRPVIEDKAIAWAVSSVSHEEIDQINILNASFLAMHRAIDQLKKRPKLLLIDGNRFKTYPGIAHQCVIGGDGIFASIAAASVLAKTYRDDYMNKLNEQFPEYGWSHNKGYGTIFHRQAIIKSGSCTYHRKSFRLVPDQLEIPFQKL